MSVDSPLKASAFRSCSSEPKISLSSSIGTSSTSVSQSGHNQDAVVSSSGPKTRWTVVRQFAHLIFVVIVHSSETQKPSPVAATGKQSRQVWEGGAARGDAPPR